MTRVKHNTKEISLLARLMRSEALGEGNTGMLLVGNVGINRVAARCQPFRKVGTIQNMIFQKPGGFAGSSTPLFFGPASGKQQGLATRAVKGWRAHPANNALYFYSPRKKPCPTRFWGKFAGKFKGHCFYIPDNIAKCRI